MDGNGDFLGVKQFYKIFLYFTLKNSGEKVVTVRFYNKSIKSKKNRKFTAPILIMQKSLTI